MNRRLWIPLVLLVAAPLGAGTFWFLSRDDTAAETTTVVGYVDLAFPEFQWEKGPDRCWGSRGMDDIKQDTQVVITGGDSTIAVARLERGVPLWNISGELTSCQFRFAASVPQGYATYGVQIASRDKRHFRPDEFKTPLRLSLRG